MNTIAAIQMNSSNNVEENLKKAAGAIKAAVEQGAKLIVLPEMFALMSTQMEDKVTAKEPFGKGPIQSFLSTEAKKNKCWIVGGTIPIASEHPDKVRAACLVYDDQGQLATRYDKIHLFDAAFSDSEVYRESTTTEPGTDITVLDTPIGKIGIAVCYDIRFPELFRHLAKLGAEIIVIPTAFAVTTGEVHWEVLAKARAIENICYVVASCQTGEHPGGRCTYGHSIIVDPWGTTLSLLTSGEGVIVGEVDLTHLHGIRTRLPVHQHRKLT